MDINRQNMLLFLFALFSFADASLNLALYKPAYQSSVFRLYNWTADLAVNGNKDSNVLNNQCSVTNDRDPPPERAWWYVDLEQLGRIKSIQITVRTGQIDSPNRLAGYDVMVWSDETAIDPTSQSGTVCYNHTGPVLPSGDQNLECDLMGRFVSVYNERLENVTYPSLYSDIAILELCEVEVHGCFIGKYGNGNCNESCSIGCVQSDCDPDNGTCLFGCKTGWMNETCDVCADGYYGMNCSDLCSPGCNVTVCDKDTGDCGSECLAGFNGTKCDICADGYYGFYCNMSCPVNCNATLCDKVDGECGGPCNAGWTGPLCDAVVQDKIVSESTLEEDLVLPIVLGCAGGVILLIIIVVAVCKTRKRKRMKKGLDFYEGPYRPSTKMEQPYTIPNRQSQERPQQSHISSIRL